MTTRYVTGDTVTLGNTFTVSGSPTDPTAVTLAVTDPLGTTTSYTYPTPATITRVSAGVYTKNIVADSPGVWRFVWTGTGTAADLQDSSFTVYTPADNRLYGSLEEIKGRLSITDTTDDLALQSAHSAACRLIDRMCGQPFWRDASVVIRTFEPENPKCLDLTCDGTVPGIATTTGLIVKLDTDDTGTFETTLTLNTDFVLEPKNAAVDVPARPYTELEMTGLSYWFNRSSYERDTVQITAVWGWPAVPAEIHEAALIQTIHLFKSGKDAQTGALFFAGGDAVGALRVSQMHPLARGLIAPYQRVAVG